MPSDCAYVPYKNTGYFSKIIVDYLNQAESITGFTAHAPTQQGLEAAMQARRAFKGDRELLVTELKKQYEGLPLSLLQQQHLENLLNDNTFTICTAHQPNIFTGHLYFIYKILHTIELADKLSRDMPGNHFVPVYYMGSEDADLDELGHINLSGEKLEWKTSQTGAVGRMKVDKHLVALIDRMHGELGVLPFGEAVIDMLKQAYTIGKTIQQATLELVNELFGKYGLLILVPDNPNLKQPFTRVVTRELTEQFSHRLVEETTKELGEHYKVQASGRDINLFYLDEDSRVRITKEGELYRVPGKEWTLDELLQEAGLHPGRFSANVILRGVFQEMILPNIAFIGGGGEIAYWLELKSVFEACEVPFPVLIVRNSFLITDSRDREAGAKLGFTMSDLFKPTNTLLEELVRRNATQKLTLVNEQQELEAFYARVRAIAGNIDPTLDEHVTALYKKVQKTIIALEKKMLRAEKRKFEASRRQIEKLKSRLFPHNSLQERVDNFAPFYARYGSGLFDELLEASGTLEQEFGILEII